MRVHPEVPTVVPPTLKVWLRSRRSTPPLHRSAAHRSLYINIIIKLSVSPLLETIQSLNRAVYDTMINHKSERIRSTTLDKHSRGLATCLRQAWRITRCTALSLRSSDGLRKSELKWEYDIQ